MANQDFDMMKAAEDFFAAFKMDTTSFDGALKNVAEFQVKMGKIALDAAKKNTKLTNDWATDTIKQLEGMNKVQKDMSTYGTVMSEFASSQAQAMPERLSQYAEIAKAAQLEAVEVIVDASKDMQADIVTMAGEAGKKAA